VLLCTCSFLFFRNALELCHRAVNKRDIQYSSKSGGLCTGLYCRAAAAHFLLDLPSHPIVLYCSWKADVKMASGPLSEPAMSARMKHWVGVAHEEKP